MKLKLLSEFRKDQEGGILAFYIIMFITMMIGGGMAVDFMRHEIKREALQDAIDRGVLAAAGNAQNTVTLTQPQIDAANLAAIATVRSYVAISGFDPDTQGLVVTPNISSYSQEVNASANFSLDTFFLRLTGIDTLGGVASARAAIGVSQIEISLIVDISGSMDGQKIQNLRTAASQFVNDMLAGDKSTYTTISLVPFSGQTAASAEMISSYNYSRWHNFSNCVDFEESDYSTTGLSLSAPLAQTQHFAPDWIYQRNSDWCPRSDIAITPFSNSIVDLDAAISNLRATGMTASQIGMKWGVALLDESSKPVVEDLITQGVVDPRFAGRPAVSSDRDTLKFVILMTDGDNTEQYNVNDLPADANQYRTYEVLVDPNKALGVSPNYNAPMSAIIAAGDDGLPLIAATGQRSAEYWDFYRMPWSFDWLYVRVDPAAEDSRLDDICTAAKDARIKVFTIGYDVAQGSNAYNQMRSCASTPGHFYDVATADLSAAFQEIKNVIQKLRLVN